MPSLIDLPPDIYGIIAEILVSDRLLGTCAKLNAGSKNAYNGTLPILWHTVEFGPRLLPYGRSNASYDWMIKCCAKAAGASYMRYVCLPGYTTIDELEIQGFMEALSDLRAVFIGIDTVFLGSGFQNGFNDWTGDFIRIRQKLDRQYHRQNEEFNRSVSGMSCLDLHLNVSSVRDGDDALIQDVFTGITTLALPVIGSADSASANNVEKLRVGHIHLTGVSLYVMESFVEKYVAGARTDQRYATIPVSMHCPSRMSETHAIRLLRKVFDEIRDIFPSWDENMRHWCFAISAPRANDFKGKVSSKRTYVISDEVIYRRMLLFTANSKNRTEGIVHALFR